MTATKTIYRDYKELTSEVNIKIENKLEDISNMDIDKLMSEIENALDIDYKVHYKDDSNIMIKVDRRKNINIILNDIDEKIKEMIGVEYASLLFKTRISDGMITVKRRR